MAAALHEAGHRVSLVNPALVRAFGQSQMKRTKTDKADAQLIARFCALHKPALHKPALWGPPAPEVRELQDLVRRVEAVEEMKQMEENRLEGACCEVVRASLLDHIAYLQSHIENTRRQIQQHIYSESD